MSDQQQEQDIAFLTDREWERIQKKTFTHWVNSKLRKVSQHVNDLTEDFRDGTKLLQLLEIISNERLPKPEKGKMRVHRVTNVNKALDFVKRKGVKLVGIAAEEIVDGNLKMTLGMIWTIILRFVLFDVGDSTLSARDGLLLWVQRKTEPYDNVHVNNFTTHWKDGLAFCALIHRHRPELIDYNSLSKDNPEYNLNLAFDVAEKHLDIPRMLDIEDMKMPVPDEKSIITYVSCYYQAFSTSHELEAAAKRLAAALDKNAEFNKLMNEYEEIASELLKWINNTIPELESRGVSEDTMQCFKGLQNEFTNYKGKVKPKWADEKNRLQNSLNTLQTLLKLNNRPEFLPPLELSMPVIDSRWKDLSVEERRRQDWIAENLKRHKSLEHLVKKFNHKCNLHESFAKGKLEDFSKPVEFGELSLLMATNNKFENTMSDLNARDSRLKVIEAIHKQLSDLNYSKIDDLTNRYEKIKNDWAVLKSSAENYLKNLQAQLEKAKQLDMLCMDFAKDASKLKNRIHEKVEDADDAYLVYSVADVNKLKEEHQTQLNELPGVRSDLGKLSELGSKIKNLTNNPNPYTGITISQLEGDLAHLQELYNTKEKSLEKELETQTVNEKLVQELVAKCNEIYNWQNGKNDSLNQVDGSLEEQLDNLKKLESEIINYHEPRLAQYNELIRKVNAAGATTDSSQLHPLESGFQQLVSSVSSRINLIENQILIRDSSSITDEQMKEYQRVFNSLDRHQQGFLPNDDFRNFLIALDYKVKIGDTEGDREFDVIAREVDPPASGRFTLSGFLNYVASSSKAKDSVEDMVEAFKIIAGGKPFITEDELKRELPKQANMCISKMRPYTGPDAKPGALDYNSFASSLYGSSDL